jgi:hypothetical protein
MITKLDIINAALVSLGVSSVQELESTTQGRAAAAMWNLTLAATLRSHPWNFAITRATLAASTTTPDHGYARKFPLPSDWLRTIEVYQVDDYKQESGAIICNSYVISIRYVSAITDPARFDALFCDALSNHLAAKLAYPLTQSSSQQAVCWDAYKEVLRLARSVDSLEDMPDELPESSLITMRGVR